MVLIQDMTIAKEKDVFAFYLSKSDIMYNVHLMTTQKQYKNDSLLYSFIAIKQCEICKKKVLLSVRSVITT